MSPNCEQCRKPEPRIATGPFAGSGAGFEYCAECSMDLCDDCLDTKHCEVSKDGKHHRDEEESNA